ncbi:MAG: mycothione reductase [Acidimicrobiaceae bacterium]|nr:mycothione reductase [Acidimicrobiaceae bacterium]
MRHHDLLIVGAGSGNSVAGNDYSDMDVAIVEPWAFGGTCLNRGCIPSKMFVHTADVALSARRSGFLGVNATFEGADWPAIRDRVFGRIDPIALSGRDYRVGLENVTVYENHARFTGERRVDIDGTSVSADQIVIAAGGRPVAPDLPGLAEVPFHTSDSIMRLASLPEHLVILGGGFIATEMAHVFEALGSQVTIVHRGDMLLRGADESIRERITAIYSARMGLHLNTTVTAVSHDGGFTLDLSDGSSLEAEQLLVATGRRPNSDRLDVAAGGIDTDERGLITTDDYLRTSSEGIWALGDITNPAQLKHTANAEARILTHNLLNPEDLRAVDNSLTPHAVFGHPQIGSVGRTERELVDAGTPHTVAVRSFSDTAYGWAMEDSTGFVKLLADPSSRLLLGAHILGPHAPTLIQQLIQGMTFGQTVDEMARGQLYVHPAMPEVVEQALLDL